ncbi:hypothetical protein PACTADRAFT_48692 [Pachysolen tannophilus NRRL Y-2460]|uniref:Transport and Golgi organization protein 2 n=1 Tax=Pachysolen tannophilus NRRL Y-2460 TaxID=669874 RepID=A0A1E4TYS7_PACTA|nr:hypothetical protein PACTADRAFT_48692 [Pachysolen tannophilus NRRL Y-2460]
MCILLSAYNAHPDYALILLSNRDEYFVRKTSPASYDKKTNTIAPYDLSRPECGTWIMLNTKTNKLAILLNFREEDDDEQVAKLESEFGYPDNNIGGFSLVFGNLQKLITKKDTMYILSNRAKDSSKQPIFNKDYSKSYFVFSNSSIDIDTKWRKIDVGTNCLKELIEKNYNLNEKDLINKLFELLSKNDLNYSCKDLRQNFQNLKDTIFVPPLINNDKLLKDGKYVGQYYGTRTQTIILINKNGDLKYIEKTLHSKDSSEVENSFKNFEYNIFNNENVKEY